MKKLEHDKELTEGIMRRGFPRPIFDTHDSGWRGHKYNRFLPTPYTAQTGAIALLSDTRAEECLRDVVCSVCGETVEFVHGHIPVLLKDGCMVYESGPFHEKCATLTMKLCPHIANDNRWSIAMVEERVWLIHQGHWTGSSVYSSSVDLHSVQP